MCNDNLLVIPPEVPLFESRPLEKMVSRGDMEWDMWL